MNVTDLQAALSAYARDWDTNLTEKVDGVAASCPHCGVYASFDQINAAGIAAGTILASLREGSLARQIIQLQCPSCRGLSIVASAYEFTADNHRSLSLELLWPPLLRANMAPKDLCDGPRKDYDEACKVLALSPTAAALLARRCLQHVLRTKLSVSNDTLFKEIEQATNSSELSSHTCVALNHVREFGNFAAHPEIDEAHIAVDVSAEEAAYTLDVLERLFDDLYRVPLQVQQMGKRLESGRGKGVGDQ